MVRPVETPRRPGHRAFLDPRRRQRIAAGVLLVVIVACRLWTAAREADRSGRDGAPASGDLREASESGSRGAGAGNDEQSSMVEVRRIVDGDTLLLRDGTRVRLIGVDTPETKREDTPVQPWGPEASEYTRKFITQGAVRLQFDGERHDNYGRLLAHVYVGDQCLNVELLRAGLARALYRHPYSNAMKDQFRAAENEAKRAQRGIWSGNREITR